MSYGGYSQAPPYGRQPANLNASDPRSNPYGPRGVSPGGNSVSRDPSPYSNPFEDGANVEMQPLNDGHNGASNSPMAILDQCRFIDQGIDEIDQNLASLSNLQRATVYDPNWSPSPTSESNRRLEALNKKTMDLYRLLVSRVRKIKSQPASQEPRNSAQVGRVERRLKKAIEQYRVIESDFRKEMQQQMERQYRIVAPEATDAEVREAVQDSNQQVFMQALYASGRRGQAQSVLSEVKHRHAAIQQIEQQVIELAQLFKELDEIVMLQDASIQRIDEQGEMVREDVQKATEELGGAVEKARSARRKKWWTLLVVLLILIVIAIIVAIVVKTMTH
ncbi:t-SNARE [Xylona heveae TC161]|uniref:t-SNARE n=1 Tax=Xylona heveae (strain CBS 132557 / TC161) TaxID=1328760 RepID=A0A165I1P6_XYLHT|nr:t-SNARE [Xylona heveae TC161]KZF24233.1 t-SNARE [Xylona heveae TC161]